VAAVALALAEGQRASLTSRRRQVTAAMREAAEFLGNTPAVARASYVDPRVIDRFEEGRTIRPALDRMGGRAFEGSGWSHAVELAVLHLQTEGSEALVPAA